MHLLQNWTEERVVVSVFFSVLTFAFTDRLCQPLLDEPSVSIAYDVLVLHSMWVDGG